MHGTARIAGAALAATLGLGLGAGSARADRNTDFLARLNGSWTGSGQVRSAPGAAPGATRCRLTGSGSGNSVTISGACDGAAKNAQIVVDLRWSAPTGQVLGTFQGGGETGTARLAGKISGRTLTMQVTSQNGGTGHMVLTFAGDRSASLKVTGRDRDAGGTVTWVDVRLSKG
ncbi:hypothetical protein [Methyloraptor flagellatus]|uniref:DUF1579 domain-containing protein n=1 Tax=Methyloraptor flagellatus TaxID=3162530 RepID=A0AAU7XBD9_9HYPH